MLRIATHFPYQTWRNALPTVDELGSLAKDWGSLRGVRPANHPRKRIEQYVNWMELAPDWPSRLRELSIPAALNDRENASVRDFRKRVRLSAFKRTISKDICAGVLGGSRLDTWICNLALPFRGALDASGEAEWGRLWEAWYSGDAPVELLGASRRIRGTGQSDPDSNGLVQGLFAAQFDREAR
jgi:hypothetical protein